MRELSKDEINSTLFDEVFRLKQELNEMKKRDSWILLQCEECEANFAIDMEGKVIDEPICPVCSSDNVRDAE